MLDKSLKNKKIIISAGASGIGWATTKVCVAKGALIYLCDADPKAINKVKKHPSYNKRIFVSETDASDETEVIDFFHKIKKKFRNLDALINNVGIAGPTGTIEKLDSSEWENTLHKDIKLAYLPRPGLVRLRLSTIGNDEIKQNKLINSELEKLKEYIEFNESEINLNQLVHDKFIKSNFTLSVAESCSSGIIASELTSNTGSSKYFSGGIIAYSDKIKQDILDIDKEIIKKQSSVCSDVAKLMVENVAKKFSSDFSISTTGYASPSNDNNITVGKVFIGIKTPHSLFVEEFLFSGDRKIIIQQVKDKALELLLNEIKKIK